MSQIVLNMIAAICIDDASVAYKVQDYKVDCIEYYTSCVVDNGKTVTAVESCQDESRRFFRIETVKR